MKGLLSALLGVGALVGVQLVGATSTSATTPIQLILPQGDAFAVLGYSCGGITEQTYATGFDPSSGYPTGDIYLKTTCSTGGRGSHPVTYTAWAGATWDDTGAIVTYGGLSSTPTVDPGFSAFDAYGNEVYNQPYNAYLLLAPGFVPAPRVTSVSPTDGPATGGTVVTITGTGFDGASAVDFGSTPASSVVVNSSTSITATAPSVSSTETVDIVVVNASGPSATSSSDQFTFVAQPVVSGLSPSSGPVGGGSWITVSGANFTYATGVNFGGTPTSFTVLSDSSISAFVPASDSGPDSAKVSVSSLGGTSPSVPGDLYTYVGPKLTVAPNTGAPSTTITASGTGFRAGESVKVVYQTGLAAPNPSSVLVCKGTALASGAVSCTGAVPSTTTAGALGKHTVKATGLSSGTVASATFTLT